MLRDRAVNERELREAFEFEWEIREHRLLGELETQFKERLMEELQTQRDSLQRNFMLEKEKMARQIKDQYQEEIDILRKEMKALKNLRVADKLQPEDEPESVVETE